MRWYCESTLDSGRSILQIIQLQIKGTQRLRINGERPAWLHASSQHAGIRGLASVADLNVRFQTYEGGPSKVHEASGRWRASKIETTKHASPSGNTEGRILDDEVVPLRSSIDTGVSIDRKGQLKIVSTARALRRHETVLIVSSTSTNFVSSDFTRLLPSPSATEAQNNERTGVNDDIFASSEGFKLHAEYLVPIPGRDVDFNRLPYWILRFERPDRAAIYQHRLHWYHANAMLNQPIETYTAATTKKRELIAPEDYIDPVSGEDIWKRLNEFSLLLPTQDFNVTALLSPLPASISSALTKYDYWNFPTESYKAWPVRIFVNETTLSVAAVEQFLSEDEKKQGMEWRLVTGAERMEPMQHVTINEKGRRFQRRCSSARRGGEDHTPLPTHKNWVLRFLSEDDALLFWRTWHRRPFPSSPAPPSGCKQCLLHVEPLW